MLAGGESGACHGCLWQESAASWGPAGDEAPSHKLQGPDEVSAGGFRACGRRGPKPAYHLIYLSLQSQT